MKNNKLKLAIVLFVAVFAFVLSSCSKKTCPAYSQANPTQVVNKA